MIENKKEEIKASSASECEIQEERLLKRMEAEGWELTGMVNPAPFFNIYYFLRDDSIKKIK